MKRFKSQLAYFSAIIGFLCSFSTFGQVSGDYRAVASGSWTTAQNWERFNGSSWVQAVTSPTSADNVITILNGVNITISSPSSITVDQLIVQGALVVSAGATLTLNDGAGTDLDLETNAATVSVDGTFRCQNLATINNPFAAVNFAVGAGASYYHNYTTSVGNLPTATWHETSTLLLTTFSNTLTITGNTSWNQSFGNLVYNAPNQRGLVDFGGNIQLVRGDFTVLNTGTNVLQLGGTETYTLTVGDANTSVGGDVSIGGTSRVSFSTSGQVTLNVYGDLNYTSSNSSATHLTFTGSATLNLYGAFMMNATANGRFRTGATGTTAVSTLNLYGNFSLISGRIDETGTNPTRGTFNFLRNGIQQFVNSGTISGYFNYYVSPATTLELGTSPLQGTTPATFTLDGGTIVVGSLEPLGALHSGNSLGNIRTPNALRTYNPGSRIIYRGDGPQTMGSGQPLSSAVTTIIDNTNGVRLITNTSIDGVLRLESGTLNLNNYRLTMGGTVEYGSGNFAGSTLSSLFIQGNGNNAWGDLRFDAQRDTLSILTINRTGTNVSVNLTSSLTIASQLNLTYGTLTNNGTLRMVPSSLITRYETSALTGVRPTVTDGSYNVTYRTFSPSGGPFANMQPGVELPVNTTDLNDFTVFLQQTGDSFTLSNSVWINGIMTFVRGTVFAGGNTITMQGPNWNDNSGNFDGGTSSVIFNSTTAVNGTSNPSFVNIQLTSTANVTFVRNVTVTGNISMASGSMFDMGNTICTLSGTNAQTVNVNGASFSNINVAKTGAPVILTSALNLIGTLQFVSPSTNIDLQSNGHLRLVSTSDAAGFGTARIFRLLNGNTVSGNVTVERFMSGEGRLYRYISSPVTNAMVSQWKDDFLITGNFADPSPNQILCGFRVASTSTSLFYYDETAAGAQENGWIGYPLPGQSTASSPLVVGRGYSTFIRQCSIPTIIDVTGPINQGVINLPVTYTVDTPAGDGWNLIGNPYPCAIDWDLGFTKTRISPIISIMDNAAGMMRYYDPGVTNEIPNGEIALGQAFWVRATAANPILTARENSKVTTVPEFYREGQTIPSMVISLTDGTKRDFAYIKTVAGSLPGLDSLDAPKITNPGTFSLSTLTLDNISMAINALESLACGTTIGLKLNNLEAGSYRIAADTRSNFSEFRFVLVDKSLNNEIELTDGYSFDLPEATDLLIDRFEIRIEQRLPAVNIPLSITQGGCSPETTISLSSSEDWLQYAAYTSTGKALSSPMQGTGSSLNIRLSSATLLDGDQIIIKGIGLCGAVQVGTPLTFAKDFPAVTSATSLSLCDSKSVKLSAIVNNPSYRIEWFEKASSGSPVATGESFETVVDAKGKTFYAEAVSDNGCRSERIAVKAQATRMEPVSITKSGTKLYSNFDAGNHWYKDGELLEGENGSALVTFGSGTYELKVVQNGCETSALYWNEETPGWLGFHAYPNPVKSTMTVEGIAAEVQKIEISSLAGQEIGTIYHKGQKFDPNVDLSFLPEGVYLLIVTKNAEKHSVRFIKSTK